MLENDAYVTLAVVIGMFCMMVSGRSAAAAILLSVIVLLCTGVIDANQAFSGFSNAAPITVGALYVIARSVERTGALQPLLSAAVGKGDGAVGLLRLLLPSAAASAFLNNTPIVAMLIPGLRKISEERSVPASRVLMPLSFAVILGGVITTIGTSTSLVVSGLLEASGQAPLGMFEVTYVGLPIAIVGLAILALLAPRLLPDRESPRLRLDDADREFVVRMEVVHGGPLEGATVDGAGLRHLQGVFLVEIERAQELIAPVSPTTRLQGGDSLLFVGEAKRVADLRSLPGTRSAEQPHLIDLDVKDPRWVEVVVGAGSPLLGHTPREVDFRRHYDAAIVGIHREGRPVVAKLGAIRLRLGDTLLLLASDGFAGRWRDRRDFLLVSALDQELKTVDAAGYFSIVITLGVVFLAGSGFVPILHAALAGAALLIVTGVLSFQEARSSVDMEVLLVIAGAFGVGAAIEQSGLGSWLGHAVVQGTLGESWRWTLLGVVVATLVLTEFISNNAAAALMFPIAMAIAGEVGADPRAFAIAVAMTASCSFLTPVGYQTNMMVYGPGGYRFADYSRLGGPLTLAAVVTIVWMV